jgi:hypothetical protein
MPIWVWVESPSLALHCLVQVGIRAFRRGSTFEAILRADGTS